MLPGANKLAAMFVLNCARIIITKPIIIKTAFGNDESIASTGFP